ncbi:hypothetical protein WA1_02170 [Scytonema hofmannii PCC 7110]|uniref:Uncharacterized protein n=1 Tax=Scytonema hofmannii PCC 7110 TaxID=128403 RepID=A0A139XH01_9CYAN|nr:hypothetical protein [Scytonema hofmannii]KYC43974.1 hypothetical protein WA1_02170 [Scytonema hofmannii PCC 7110]
MYQTYITYRKEYFSRSELNFIIKVLRGKQCELLGFIAEVTKATNSIKHDASDIETDVDPDAIGLKLLVMPYDAMVDFHTRLQRLREFPDAHYRLIERLQEVELL